MALKMALDSGLTNLVSTGGTETNPILTNTLTTGGTQTVQVWLYNDDSTVYYTGVTITPTGTDSSWFQLSTDNVTYQAAGAALTMPDLGKAGTADTTGHTFYVKVTTPSGQAVANITANSLQAQGSKYAV